jgi:hypothetical protein
LAKANATTTLALMTTGQHKLSETYGFLASINNGKPETLSSMGGGTDQENKEILGKKDVDTLITHIN